MNTIKYFSKTILMLFLLLSSLFIVSIFIFLSLTYVYTQDSIKEKLEPNNLFYEITKSKNILLNEAIKQDMRNNEIWMMVLDNNGNISDEFNLPSELHKSYSNQDIVKFTRWYLGGYPVFSYIFSDKIIVLGYPETYYAKLPSNYYNFNLYLKLFKLAMYIILFILITLLLIYLKTKANLLKEIKPIKEALIDLSRNKEVSMKENGNLLEIKQAINKSSKIFHETKSAKNHWIRGVSHDLRNPLTLIIAYVNSLENKYGVSIETEEIKNKINSMQETLANLNINFLLEKEQNFEKFDLSKLLKEIIVEYINEFNLDIKFDLSNEACFINCNKNLITRVIKNTINNSMTHNKEVAIKISLSKSNEVVLIIEDNGTITEEKIKEIIEKETNYETHGMGILIMKQIINIHNGKIIFSYNNPGLKTTLFLPKA